MKIISVDLQKDFTREGGRAYRPRPAVPFIKEIFLPFAQGSSLLIAEIVSDYRLPRPGDSFECCIPGTGGYESEIPVALKKPDVWVKCMNSPEWTRDNAGDCGKEPGLPRPDADGFSRWLMRAVGEPGNDVLLIGLTLDCCVLATALALAHRAYNVFYLVEAVDAYSGDPEEKAWLFRSAANNWGTAVTFDQLRSE